MAFCRGLIMLVEDCGSAKHETIRVIIIRMFLIKLLKNGDSVKNHVDTMIFHTAICAAGATK